MPCRMKKAFDCFENDIWSMPKNPCLNLGREEQRIVVTEEDQVFTNEKKLEDGSSKR